jgi:hypothetical protein
MGSILDNLPHTASHIRQSQANDAYGAPLKTDSTQEDNLSVWIQNASFKEITEFEKDDIKVTHKALYTDSSYDFRAGDVLVAATAPFASHRFFVRAHTERTAGLGWMFVVFLERERNENPSAFAS